MARITAQTAPWLRNTAIGAMLAVACSAGCTAGAQTLTILPVTVSLPARQQAAVITLVNSGQTDMSVQVRAFAWSQSIDGVDHLDPTDVLAVSPPLATIPAGRKQIVRLVLRQPARAGEATYRLLVDQIPGPVQVNEVRVTLRSSLPVFAEPQQAGAPKLRFGTELIDGRLYLVAVNDGKRHDSIRTLTLRTADGATVSPIAGTSPYLLAGATRRWPIANATAASGGDLRLTAVTEKSGTIERTITVARLP